MDYYSAIERSVALIHAATPMNLKGIMPGERPVTKDHILSDAI